MTWNHDTQLVVLVLTYLAIGVTLTLGIAAPIARWRESRERKPRTR